MEFFDIEIPAKTEKVPISWGVHVMPVYDEDGRVSEIDVEVVRISSETVRVPHVSVLHDLPCVMVGENCWVPVSCFIRVVRPEFYDPCHTTEPEGYYTSGDTHDLRSFLFETEEEARDYAGFVNDRFDHPQSWESFVRT